MTKKTVRLSLLLLLGIALLFTLACSSQADGALNGLPENTPSESDKTGESGVTEDEGTKDQLPGEDNTGSGEDGPEGDASGTPVAPDNEANTDSEGSSPDSGESNTEDTEIENGGMENVSPESPSPDEDNGNTDNGSTDEDNGSIDGDNGENEDDGNGSGDADPELPDESGNEEAPDYIDILTQIVKGELGTKEKKYNNIKYNTWFYGRTVKATSSASSSYAWCITFISWCADQAGISTDIIPKENNAERLRAFFVEQGLYEARKNHTVSVGDIIFYGKKTANHAGIVIEVTDTTVTVIEGNYSDKVSILTYNLSSTSILGYATPDYNAGK